MLARISGDEFLLLLDPVEGEEQVRTTIAAILDDLKQPFHIEAFELLTSASIGVTMYPEHGTSYEALRRNADNAMYRAKKRTKGDAIYFNANMGTDDRDADGARAAPAAGDPRPAILLRIPAQGRHPQQRGDRLRDARALAGRATAKYIRRAASSISPSNLA